MMRIVLTPLPFSRVRWALFLALLATFSIASYAADELSTPLRVERYRNLVTGRHAFTTELEAGQPFTPPFVKEEVPETVAPSPLFYFFREQYGSTAPIYQLRAKDGSMLFAATLDERQSLLNAGYEDIGQPVFLYTKKVEGSTEVFRIANLANGDVLYTTSPEEKEFYLRQGWAQLQSLGFGQPTSSAGSGSLRSTTVLLDSEDVQLVSGSLRQGQTLVLALTNPKVALLVPGTIVYSEKNSRLPLGIVAKVVNVSQTSSGGVQVDTVPVSLGEAFDEVHLYIESRPLYFLPSQFGSNSTTMTPPSRRALPDEIPAAVAHSQSRPEYLSAASITVTRLPDGGSFSLQLGPVTKQLYNATAGNASGSLSVTTGLEFDVTGELVYNSYNQCPVNPKVTFLLTGHEKGTVSVTATGQVSTAAEQPLLEDPDVATFPVGGIPVSVGVNFYAGLTGSASITGTLTATEEARATAGVQYELTSMNLSPIACPNPCPSGFTCGGATTGPTCTLPSYSLQGSIITNAQFAAYVRPEVDLYLGGWGTGVGVFGYTKLQLEADLQSPVIAVYGKIIPGVGAKVEVCSINIAEWGPEDLDGSTISQLLGSFRLPPPTAHFSMTGGGKTANDGGTLSLTLAKNGSVAVTMKSTSVPGSAAIASYAWKSNGSAICSNSSTCTFTFGTASNTITLTVTDANGQTSTAKIGRAHV